MALDFTVYNLFLGLKYSVYRASLVEEIKVVNNPLKSWVIEANHSTCKLKDFRLTDFPPLVCCNFLSYPSILRKFASKEGYINILYAAAYSYDEGVQTIP